MKEDIKNYLGDKVNECIWDYIGSVSGEVHQDDAIKMESLLDDLSALCEKIVKYNKYTLNKEMFLRLSDIVINNIENNNQVAKQIHNNDAIQALRDENIELQEINSMLIRYAESPKMR